MSQHSQAPADGGAAQPAATGSTATADAPRTDVPRSHHSIERGGSEEAMSGPGAAYHVFVIMEELVDKLKLLHYEQTYCKQLGFKPFSRYSIL